MFSILLVRDFQGARILVLPLYQMLTKDFKTILRSPSLVEQVCQKLAVMLRADRGQGDLKLPAERDLAAKLGVSRNVIREATKRLEIQGMLEIRQGQDTRVVDKLHKPLTATLNMVLPQEKERMRQLFEVRLIIEPQHARLAATRATKIQLRKIEAAHTRLIEAQDVDASVAADMDFHREIAQGTGNQILRLILESLAELLAASHSTGFRAAPSSRTLEEHAAILHAIKSCDAATADRAMELHLKNARADLGI
jgi:GntR family transcriptional repressor for pyruvate dehydrogenase complex